MIQPLNYLIAKDKSKMEIRYLQLSYAHLPWQCLHDVLQFAPSHSPNSNISHVQREEKSVDLIVQ